MTNLSSAAPPSPKVGTGCSWDPSRVQPGAGTPPGWHHRFCSEAHFGDGGSGMGTLWGEGGKGLCQLRILGPSSARDALFGQQEKHHRRRFRRTAGSPRSRPYREPILPRRCRGERGG